METAEIVKIAVSAAPYSIDKPYDYLVPRSCWKRRYPASGSPCPSAGATAPVRALFWPDAR
ncbi:MAG: hypothetical protein ACLTYN_15355 [Dysosmobacter welbionis]